MISLRAAIRFGLEAPCRGASRYADNLAHTRRHVESKERVVNESRCNALLHGSHHRERRRSYGKDVAGVAEHEGALAKAFGVARVLLEGGGLGARRRDDPPDPAAPAGVAKDH